MIAVINNVESPELREAFLDDASGCIGSMEESLLRLDHDRQDADALNQICRELHTLKMRQKWRECVKSADDDN